MQLAGYILADPLDTEDPVADAGMNQTVDQGVSVTFNGSGSTDNVGIVNYTWTFIDGVGWTVFGMSPVHIFYNASSFSVTLNVTDAAGNWNTDTMMVSVMDIVSPSIQDNTAMMATTGDSFTFNATVTDNVVVDAVWVNYWYGAGGRTNVSMTNIDGDYYELTITLADITSALHYNISAVDVSLNWAETGDTNYGNVADNDVPYLVADNSDGTGTTGDACYYNVSVQDNIAVETVLLFWSHGGASGNISLTFNEGYWLGSIVLGDLLENMTYYLWFNDTSGNMGSTGIFDVAVEDNDAPYFIQDNTAGTGYTGDEFEFSVNVSDNIGVDTVLLNWSHGDVGGLDQMTNSGGNSWTLLMGLDHNITDLVYSFLINDTSGVTNVSQGIHVPVIDNDMPTVVDVTAGNPTTGDMFIIEVMAMDNIALAEVSISYSFDGHNFTLPVSMHKNDENYTFTVNISAFASKVYYVINASDICGNWNSGVPEEIVVLDNDPAELLFDNTSDMPTTGENFHIIIGISDNVELGENILVQVNYTFNGEFDMSKTLSRDTQEDSQWSVDIDILINSTIISYYFFIVDSSQNVLVTEVTQLSVQDTIFPRAVNGGDRFVDQNEIVYFDGSGSSDNIEIINYTWYVDSTIMYGENVNHTFPTVGTYSVILNVSDLAGNWNVSSLLVTVLDITPPLAYAGEDIIVDQGIEFTLNAVGSTDNVGVVEYEWTFVENGVEVFLSTMAVNYTFLDPGIYIVTLNVTDAAGLWAIDHLQVQVVDKVSPEAKIIGNDTCKVGDELLFNGSGSYDNMEVVNYTWAICGDIMFDSGVYYTFNEPGEYVVVLSVEDAAGNQDVDSHVISVNELEVPDTESPVIKAVTIDGVMLSTSEPTEVEVGEIIAFHKGDSDDNVGIITYIWLLEGPGGEKCLTGAAFNYKFDIPGVYTLSLSVYDGAGNADKEVYSLVVLERSDVAEEYDGVETKTLVFILAFIGILIFVIVGSYLKKKSSGSLDDYYDEVDDDMEEIIEYRCPECDAVVSDDDDVCLNCGAEFEEEVLTDREIDLFECLNCGLGVRETDTSCPECGVYFDMEDNGELEKGDFELDDLEEFNMGLIEIREISTGIPRETELSLYLDRDNPDEMESRMEGGKTEPPAEDILEEDDELDELVFELGS